MFFGNKEKKYEESIKVEDIGLSDEKDKILAIIDSFPDGIIIFNESSRVSSINFRAEVLFDVASHEVVNKDILELNQFVKLQPLVSLLGGGIRKVLREEISIGENLILEVSVIPIMVKGKKTGSLVVLHDITKSKMVEKAKSEFVTVAAHQLRTPSSATKWTTKMLLDGDLGPLTKEQKEAVSKAYISNEKVINLVNALLGVAQIEEGKYLSNLALSDITEIVLSVLKYYEESFDKKGVKVILQKPEEELPKLMLDKEKMEIAITGLVDNALRYTLSGGKVSVYILKKEREIEVAIEDTGCGIPKGEQVKVFSKFFRGSNVMKIDTEGTGLGLFIVKNIIEAHGGTIWFESQENKGSVFHFSIPIKERFGEFLDKSFY